VSIVQSPRSLFTLLVAAAAIAADSAPGRVRTGEVAPVFAGAWRGTYERNDGASEVTVCFERDRYTTRVVIAPGNVAYGGNRGGIRAEPGGKAWIIEGSNCLPAIYRVEGTRVRVCFCRSAARPREFGVTSDACEWLLEPIPVKK
jgi:hypothetical protein